MDGNIYRQLEDGLFAAFSSHFGNERFIFPFQNAPEPQTPYVVIDIQKITPSGMPHSGGVDKNDNMVITQDYIVRVVIETLGEYDCATSVGDLAHKLEFSIRTPLFQQALARNNLSLLEYRSVDRFPRKRDTKTYMCYQQGLYFAYSVTEVQCVGYINDASVRGVLHDAGRESNVIETQIEIQP